MHFERRRGAAYFQRLKLQPSQTEHAPQRKTSECSWVTRTRCLNPATNRLRRRTKPQQNQRLHRACECATQCGSNARRLFKVLDLHDKLRATAKTIDAWRQQRNFPASLRCEIITQAKSKQPANIATAPPLKRKRVM